MLHQILGHPINIQKFSKHAQSRLQMIEDPDGQKSNKLNQLLEVLYTLFHCLSEFSKSR